MTDDSIDLRVTLNDPDNIRKFDQIQQYMIEEIPDSKTDKTGNAAAMRLAIQMANERLENIKQEKREAMQDFERIERKMRKQAENL